MPSTGNTSAKPASAGFRPRLDLTLVAFAAAGAAIAAWAPIGQRDGAPSGRYAIAISNGDELRLAAGRREAAQPADPGARVLSCRRVVSLGPLDVGARCRTADEHADGHRQTAAAAD